MLRMCLSEVLLLIALISPITAEQKRVLLPAGPGQPPFDVTIHSVPIEELLGGGPPKDGIPALDHPKFVAAAEAGRFLHDRDKVLAVIYNGVIKAYPVRILNWHEIVNDDFGGKPVAVTW